ncbi:MAG: hypothetical protein HYZ81_18580 [Nitrospinae bacterium]|nr:hypothetical protein [Nitrospinota bacterium]
MDLRAHYERRLASRWRRAPYVLRITEWKDMPAPVLVVKERQGSGPSEQPSQLSLPLNGQSRSTLLERGHLAGESLRRCLPIVRGIVGWVCDDAGVPVGVDRYLTQEGLKLRLSLPLDEGAGAKLALIFRLQERVANLDRVELIARRVARCTREEAAYWLSRTTSFGPDASRWALSGLRIMLGGQAGDPAVPRMLARLRDSA